MQTNIDITKAFLEVPDGVLSIHQLSQKLKLPYGTTYNRIHQLNQQKIIQILHQGKAKLCALNPDNPMSASLLALGGAQKYQEFSNKLEDNGLLLKKITNSLKRITNNNIIASILISPDSFIQISKDLSTDYQENLNNNFQQEITDSIDFFFIKSDEQFDETVIETEISKIINHDNINITSMVVDKETLLGMLKEEENEAGLAAYSMLQDGIILSGFENFYQIILETFTKKLSGLS